MQGDSPLFCPPTARFNNEIARLPLRPSRHPAIHVGPEYDQQLLTAETTDLQAALKARKLTGPENQRIVDQFAALRRALLAYEREVAPLIFTRSIYDAPDTPTEPLPAFPAVTLPAGLPDEFRDYLEGALVWRNLSLEDKTPARLAWERILRRPAAERRWKSVWAAYMLGRYWETREPDLAIDYFRKTRSFANRGCPDSTGLAAASLGREARIHYKRKDYEPALRLYLEQLATGDTSATNSLGFVASAVFAHPETQLAPLVRDQQIRSLLTSYLACRSNPTFYEDNPGASEETTSRWLTAMESTDIRDVESAEKLALIAYKANQTSIATRWLNRAKDSPFAQWLRAKLLFREGKIAEATKLLAAAARGFPLAPPDDPGSHATPWYEASLFLDEQQSCSAAQAVHAELGMLQLTRGEYREALDSLLRAGFWQDAAYVAERVLTTTELKEYVDANWPFMPREQTAGNEQATSEDEFETLAAAARLTTREHVRYLLARRLARAENLAEARPYFPSEWQPQLDALQTALSTGDQEVLAPEVRAEAWLAAAYITRTNGLELLGTELQPDWRWLDGDFEGPMPSERAKDKPKPRINLPSTDELERAAAHDPNPNLRWHYRYRAAALCWDAAALLPDNTDQTAFILWQGGWWLRNIDPETADYFYKTLVRRNPGTELGIAADRLRWFPKLGEDRRPIPPEPRPTTEAPDTAPPVVSQGYLHYVLHLGDSLPVIARKVSELGVPTSVAEILAANPELDPARLRVGQSLRIPAPNAEVIIQPDVPPLADPVPEPSTDPLLQE